MALHRYLAISQASYDGLLAGEGGSWEGPFETEADARQFVENEFGIPALVVDLGAAGAREWARVEALRSPGEGYIEWTDRRDAAMAELLRKGRVLGLRERITETATPRRDHILSTIARHDRRAWSQLPPDYERDAVKSAHEAIRKFFDKRDVNARIAASRSVTFEELRAAVMRMEHLE